MPCVRLADLACAVCGAPDPVVILMPAVGEGVGPVFCSLDHARACGWPGPVQVPQPASPAAPASCVPLWRLVPQPSPLRRLAR